VSNERFQHCTCMPHHMAAGALPPAAAYALARPESEGTNACVLPALTLLGNVSPQTAGPTHPSPFGLSHVPGPPTASDARLGSTNQLVRMAATADASADSRMLTMGPRHTAAMGHTLCAAPRARP
jgi:hypothetical protein